MSEVPRFNDRASTPRCVLALGGELAAIEIWGSEAGFRLKTEDQSPMLEDEPSVVRETSWLSWAAVWDAINRYRWVNYRLIHVDPGIANEVNARAQIQLSSAPEHTMKYVTERWCERWAELQACADPVYPDHRF